MPPIPPIYFHDNRELRFDSKDIMEMLEARIDEIKPVAVIVDPLYTMAPMDDYMAKAVPHMMSLKKSATVTTAHSSRAPHREANARPTADREDLWGVTFLNAFLETGWQVRPQGQGSRI